MFMQGSKAFKDEKAIAKLDELFVTNKVEERTYPIGQTNTFLEEDDEEYSEDERKKIETTGIDIKKITEWMKELNTEIHEAFVISQFEKELKKTFNGNIHVYLIIDELSPEQKETIKNIIAAFKLETGQPIIFDSNIVRLVQKINFVDSNFEYGLTSQ